MDFVGYLKVFVALLFMVDPVAAIPTYLAATSRHEASQQRRTALTAAIAVAIVLVLFCLVGESLLKLFSISIDSFRVAGGVILMMLALAMLGGAPGPTKQRPDEAEDAMEKESVGIVPLAIPLLAGPGAMSSMIVYAHQDASVRHRVVLIVIALLVALCVWVCLRAAEPLGRMLGRTGMNVATRIMGIIIAAVAVEFIATGLLGLMPGLGVTGGG